MTEWIQQTDFQILDWIQTNMRTPRMDWLVPKITFLCNKGWFWIVITLFFLIWRKYRRIGISMLMGLMLSGLIGNIFLKNLAARARPCWINQNIDMLIAIPTDYSFPSGHSMASFASAVILLHYNRRIGIPAVILAALIALSRLYLYVHFPTDVIVGTIMGILIGLIAPRIIDSFFRRRNIPEEQVP